MLRLGELLSWLVISLVAVASTETFMALSKRMRGGSSDLDRVHSTIRTIGYGALVIDGIIMMIFPASAAWEALLALAVLVASSVGIARLTIIRR